MADCPAARVSKSALRPRIPREWDATALGRGTTRLQTKPSRILQMQRWMVQRKVFAGEHPTREGYETKIEQAVITALRASCPAWYIEDPGQESRETPPRGYQPELDDIRHRFPGQLSEQ
jgi:hypothetical protein